MTTAESPSRAADGAQARGRATGMKLTDIVVCLTSVDDDMAALELAETLAEASGAHLACAAVGLLATVYLYAEYGAGAAYANQLNENNAAIQHFWEVADERLKGRSRPVELRRHKTYSANTEELMAMIGRHADLTVMRAPTGEHAQPYAEMIEGALLGSGRPVVVAPANWKRGPVGRKIVFGWDESREAARAMHDALLLAAPDAEAVIVTVDAKHGSRSHGDAPGMDIAAHLARHGLKVELRNEAGLGRAAHTVLTEVANAEGADLLVLGGYRHSRLQQALFGGVTRSLLRDPPLPLLLSH